MKLIIAEKPSLARNIVAGIGQMQKRGNYYENEEYLVTWAFGHLFSLCDIEDYTGKKPEPGKKVTWTMEGLPCFPDRFRFRLRTGDDGKPDEGIRNQFALIRSLCRRPDVDTVVNAGDSDREGEIIVRLCMMNALNTEKKLVRLWLPDQTPKTVAAALKEMKSETEYDNLANEGFARTYIDWLYGVNLTRFATLKTGKLLRVGRVIIPIVKAIYDRDTEIRNFTQDIYYGLASDAETKGEKVELTSKLRFEKNEKAKADETAAFYNTCHAVVTSKKKQKTVIPPGKLYSLTKLQNFLSKKHKLSMTESLASVQRLYEAGYVTYPRTNSEYLATAEKDKVKEILAAVKKLGYPVAFKDKKTIFDDSKIESHSALTPTYKIPGKGALSGTDLTVYTAIFRRFAAVFCAEDCVADKTEIGITLTSPDGKTVETFTLNGMVMREKGWTAFDDYSGKDKILPGLEKGDTVNVDFRPVEKKTSPPKHYTVETLNNYLKNPFREEKASAAASAAEAAADASQSDEGGDEEDYRAIFEGLELGTEATRTGIIDNARKSGYIALNKDVYTILPDGEFLIKSLSQMQISMDKYRTSEMGQILKKIYHGKMTVGEGVIAAETEISKVFDCGGRRIEEDADTGNEGDILGVCPLCGKNVIRSRYDYRCEGYPDCKTRIWFTLCDRVVSAENVRLLLSTGRTSRIEGFVSKAGKKFNAVLKFEDGKAVFDFPPRQSGELPSGDGNQT